MAKIQIKNSFITSSAQITISSSLVRFSDNIRAKGITGSFSGSFAGSNVFVQGGNSFGTTALLGTNDNQPLTLRTNNSEKMRVTAAGLVGIGTSNPGTKLQVVGDVTFGTSGGAGNLWILGDRDWRWIAGTTGYGVGSGFGLFDNTAGAYRITFDTNGNVGIGTTSPGALLAVNGESFFASKITIKGNTVGTLGNSSGLQLYQDASTDTSYIYNYYAGSMIFGTNNTARMTILSGGNVGIGTSSPTQKLEVIGAGLFGSHGAGTYSLAISNNDQTNARIRITNSGAGGRSFSIVSGNPGLSNAGFAIYDETSAATRMYISGSGNVGIGTTIPTGLLEVYASNNGGLGGHLVLNNNGNAIANETAIIFGDGVSTARRAAISSTTEDSPYYGDLKFKTGLSAYSSLTTRMIIKGAGNVGIGTSSPGNNLVVYNGSGWAGTDLNGTSGGELRFLQSGTLKANIYASTSTALVINSGDATIFQIGASEKMRLTGGNLGIGTTSPTAALEVNGSIHLNGNIRDVWNDNIWNVGQYPYNYSTSPTYYMGFQVETATRIFYISNKNNDGSATDPNGGIIFRTGGTPTNRMIVSYSGNVGIGTTSPAAKLDVAGDIKVGSGTTSTTKVTGSLHVTGSITLNASRDSNWPLLISDPSTVGGSGRYQLNKVGAMGFNYPDSYAQLQIIGASGAYIDLGNSGTDDYDARLIYYTNSRLDLTYGTTMTLNSTGVGIGTTAPLSLLDVRSGFITAGTNSSVSGTTLIAGYYSSGGNLTVLGTEYSSGGPMLGYAVTPSTSATGAFLSATGITIPRSAYIQDGASHKWYTGASQTVAIGSAVTTSEKMRLDTNGNLGIGTSSPQTLLHVNNGEIWAFGATNERILLGDSTSAGQWGGFRWNTSNDNLQIVHSGYSSGTTGAIEIISSGNVGIGTNAPIALLDVRGNTKFGSSLSNTHQFTGSVNFGGSTYNNSIAIDKFEYFSLQPYIEGGSFPSNVFSLSGTFPTFVTMTGSACPFGKVAYNVSYYEAIGDYIPVQAGETLYGEIWAYRSAGATGTAGVFYCGIARYDKDKRPIDGNAGLNYFIVQNATVPSNSTWTKYSNTTTLPLTHTPYAGSDGGPVRYVRPYIIVNYTAGTVPTYWAAFKIRKQQLTRDLGAVVVSGSMGIGTSSPSSKLHIYENANRVSYLVQNNNHTARFEAYGTATAIDTSASNGIFYRINGSDIVKFAADGNVGIGTSTVGAKLQVQGKGLIVQGITGTPYWNNNSFEIQSSGGNGVALEFHRAGYTSATMASMAGELSFYTDSGSERMRIVAGTGNVGIGTTAPAYKFDLVGSGSVSIVNVAGRIRSNVGSDVYNTGTVLAFTNTTSNANAYAYIGSRIDAAAAGDNAQSLIFATNATNTLPTEKLRITSTGNVGIGSTAPAYKLDVSGAINLTGILSFNGVAVLNTATNSNDIYANLRVIRNTSTVLNDGMYINYDSTGTTAAHLRFYANGTSERMRIQANDGFVGIGTSAAVGRLDVYDSTDAGHVAFVRNASTGTSAYSAIVLRRNGDANGIVLFTNSSNRSTDGGAGNSTIRTDNGNLLLGAGGTTYHVLNTAGSVGIGTTSPAYRLDVNGGIASGGVLVALYSGNYNRLYEPSGNVGIYLGNNSDPANYYDNNTHFFRNRGGSSTYAVIEGNGNLGIGTTSVTAPLHIYRASNPWVRLNGGGNYSYIRFDDGTSNGYLFKNTSSDTSNGALAGAMYTYTDSGKAFQHIHSGTPLFTILSGGNVGVGTTAPLSKLNSYGSGSNLSVFRVDGGNGTLFEVTDQLSGSLFSVNDVSGLPLLEVFSNNRVVAGKYGSNALVISGSSIGIGTSRPSSRLQLGNLTSTQTSATETLSLGGTFSNSAGANVKLRVYEDGSGGAIGGMSVSSGQMEVNTWSAGKIAFYRGTTQTVIIDASGNVGIGTSAPVYSLAVHTTTDVWHAQFGQVGGNQLRIGGNTTNGGVIGAYADNTNNNPRQLLLNRDGGNVGIGTSNATYNLYVNGSFAATTKSFVIKHPDPAKSDKQLVHGVTEGPEHTVFVRGKLLNNNIIQLPDYWQYLVDADTITVTLTPNKYYQQLYVKNVTDTTIEVGSETDKPINCYYYIVGERKDIPKLITEI